MISIARNVERTGWSRLVPSFSQCSHTPPENDCYSELRPPSAGTPRRPPGRGTSLVRWWAGVEFFDLKVDTVESTTDETVQ